MKTSKFLSLKTKDLIKGLITSILTAVVFGLQQSLDAGHLPVTWIDWKPVAMGAIAGALGYITKNVLTNSEDQFLKKEPKQPI